MTNWVTLTIIYALGTGIFQSAKKKAVQKNSIYEVLASLCLIAFLISVVINRDSIIISTKYIGIIFIKSFVISIAWLLAVYALKNMSMSLYGLINLSRIIFTIVLSIVFLGEKITINILLGGTIVIIGLLLINKVSTKQEKKETSMKAIICLLLACFLSAVSAIIDKGITAYISGEQLQFWFLLFLALIYWLLLLIKQENIKLTTLNKNYWVLIAAFMLAVGDKFLFMANGIEGSKAAVMTIIKQISAIEIIILGKVLFKEKDILKKLACSLFIILGVIITLI